MFWIAPNPLIRKRVHESRFEVGSSTGIFRKKKILFSGNPWFWGILESFSNTFLHAVPGEHYGTAKRMLEKTSQQIHAYIRGQLLAGTSVAITSIIGLYILQWVTGISIPYTFLIGIAAGLFNLIPFIGPAMGMIPAIIIYLVTDQIMPIHIFYILLIIGIFAVVQLIDNLIMSPYIMGGSVGLHPMLVIILVLLGLIKSN